MSTNDQFSQIGSSETPARETATPSQEPGTSSTPPLDTAPPVDRRADSPDPRERLQAALHKREEPAPAEATGEAQTGEISGPGGETGAEPAKLTPKAVAEKLEIDPSELYGMEITTGDGRTATLQSIKDAWEGQTAAEQVIAEREAEVNRREAKQSADYIASGLLAAHGKLDAETHQQIADHMRVKAEQDYRDFLTLVPEMQDDGARLNFENAVSEALTERGVNPDKLALMAMIGGPGVRVIMREFLQMQDSLAKIHSERRAADVPPKARKPQSPQPKGGNAAHANRVQAARSERNPRNKIRTALGTR